MGQTHHSEHSDLFEGAQVRPLYEKLQREWDDTMLCKLAERLKDTTANMALDKDKFSKLLHLPPEDEKLVTAWFNDFVLDRVSPMVDGVEFVTTAIAISTQVHIFRKMNLVYNIFDFNDEAGIERNEFTIFLMTFAAGLHLVVEGLPPPPTFTRAAAVADRVFTAFGVDSMTPQMWVRWILEARIAVPYLWLLSCLDHTTLCWGCNDRGMLGLSFEAQFQDIPVPLLHFEGVRMVSVASNESHSIFLSEDGRVWSCGRGFCGLLGHGDVADCAEPRLVEALIGKPITWVAVGVRHTIVLTQAGDAYTWGACELGQLGLSHSHLEKVQASMDNPRTGSTVHYVPKPQLVYTLRKKGVVSRSVACCSFSTFALSEDGVIYSWGNTADGQCGLGQKIAHSKLVFYDPHSQRTGMHIAPTPHHVEAEVKFQKLACGASHACGVDMQSRVWTWGQGSLGRLGHGDQRTMHEPKLLDSLQFRDCHEVAAGEAHTVCLTSLYRLTLTGRGNTTPIAVLGLPQGRVDRQREKVAPITVPGTALHLNAFATARLMPITMPFRYDPEAAILDFKRYKRRDIRQSVLVMERGFPVGVWLRLESFDYDFHVHLAPSGGEVNVKKGLVCHLMYGERGKWEEADCDQKICILELPRLGESPSVRRVASAAITAAKSCKTGQGRACICVLPDGVDPFSIQASHDLEAVSVLKPMVVGFMTHEQGMVARRHIDDLVKQAKHKSPERSHHGESHGWEEHREEFSGKAYFKHTDSQHVRESAPLAHMETKARIVDIREDAFAKRLEALLKLTPRGIIVCHQSCHPDLEMLHFSHELMEQIQCPVVTITHEAAEELRRWARTATLPWVTMEVQPYGGVCAWGDGTLGQLGLDGIQPEQILTKQRAPLTNEEKSFSSDPRYVATLHEQEVVTLACGDCHTVAATKQGSAFAWGRAQGVGVPMAGKKSIGVPVFIDHFDGFVKAKKIFAAHKHTFALCDAPCDSIVQEVPELEE